MRFLGILVGVAIIYLLFFRSRAVPTLEKSGQPATVGQATPFPTSPGGTNFLKRPLDRTREVLDLNRKRVQDQP